MQDAVVDDETQGCVSGNEDALDDEIQAKDKAIAKSSIIPPGSTRKSTKRKGTEEVEILRSIAKSLDPTDASESTISITDDESKSFGNYVSQALSGMDQRNRMIAINRIQNVIFQVQLSAIQQPHHAGGNILQTQSNFFTDVMNNP